MENSIFSSLTKNELLVIDGGSCGCSSAVKAIGGAFASVANYFDDLAYAIGHRNWLGQW